jgi:transcriptional regulator with XRE-family HTH domain
MTSPSGWVTTASVVARIERGQQPTSIETLGRLAEALDGRAVFGFQFDGAEEPVRVRL